MTPAEVKRARARRGEGEMLHEELLDAAERLLLEAGDEDRVSIRAIADAVGVSPPAIYLHFPDKETLFFAVSERHFAAFDDYLEEAAAGVDDPIEALRVRGRAYVRFGLERPEHYRILFMSKSAAKPDLVTTDWPAGRVAFAHLVAAVERAIAVGALRADLDPLIGAIGLWSAFHGVTSLLISLPEFPWPDLDALVGHVCDTQLRGLAPQV
jgi:AcrR family transcriptional regulator